MQTSVLIVEEEQVLAAELKQTLGHLGYVVAGIAKTAAAIAERIIMLRPDVVLLDVGVLESFAGPDATRRLQAMVDPAVICVRPRSFSEPGGEKELRLAIELALLCHEKEQRLRRLAGQLMEAFNYHEDPVFMADHEGTITFMNAPAARLLEKTATPHESSSILALLVQRNCHHCSGGKLDSLSRREQEVLSWFIRGYGTSRIGVGLGVSPQTVRNHLKSVCKKLEVKSQIELREFFADGGDRSMRPTSTEGSSKSVTRMVRRADAHADKIPARPVRRSSA